MNNTLIDQLSRLKMEEVAVKRGLDKNLSSKERTKMFNRLKEIKAKKEIIKFKLELERKMKK